MSSIPRNVSLKHILCTSMTKFADGCQARNCRYSHSLEERNDHCIPKPCNEWVVKGYCSKRGCMYMHYENREEMQQIFKMQVCYWYEDECPQEFCMMSHEPKPVLTLDQQVDMLEAQLAESNELFFQMNNMARDYLHFYSQNWNKDQPDWETVQKREIQSLWDNALNFNAAWAQVHIALVEEHKQKAKELEQMRESPTHLDDDVDYELLDTYSENENEEEKFVAQYKPKKLNFTRAH